MDKKEMTVNVTMLNSDEILLIFEYLPPKDAFYLARVNKEMFVTVTHNSHIITSLLQKIWIPLPQKTPFYFQIIEHLKIKEGYLTDDVLKTFVKVKTLKIGEGVVFDDTSLYSDNEGNMEESLLVKELSIYCNKSVNGYHLLPMRRLEKLNIENCSHFDCSEVLASTNTLKMIVSKGTQAIEHTIRSVNLKTLILTKVRRPFSAYCLRLLTKLTELDISDNTVTDLNYITNLTRLKIFKAQSLRLGGFPPVDIVVPKSVNHVNINNNRKIKKIEGINIQYLEITGITSHFNFKCLNNLSSLKSLTAEACDEIVDEDIMDLKLLENLNLSKSFNFEGKYLNNFTKLKLLKCHNIGCHLNLRELEYLSCRGSNILNNDDLVKCTNLTTLHLWYCEHVNGSVLRYLPMLKDVVFGDSKVEDNDVINLQNVEKLWFRNVGDFKGLYLHRLPLLKTFWRTDNINSGEPSNTISVISKKPYKDEKLKELIKSLAVGVNEK
ncbi:hypothetical protein ABK040_007740 [Willaertia magna]